MHPDALRWNARYGQDPDYYLQRSPYQLLQDHAELLPRSGLALDVAAGVAPLGLFLAKRGLEVLALDISLTALRLAQRRFRQAGRDLACAVADLTDPWLPLAHFDMILDFYFLSRPLLDRCRAALKPGGLLVSELLLWDEQPGSNRANYLDPGELEARFSDWHIIQLNQGLRHGRGPLNAPGKIMQMVVQKPKKEQSL